MGVGLALLPFFTFRDYCVRYDKNLIKKCLKNDRRAQNELYRNSYDLMMALCWRYADNREEAIEFVNAGFLKVLINLNRYKDDISIDLWIRRVVINEVIDQVRKRNKYKQRNDLREESKMPEPMLQENRLSILQENKLEWIRAKTLQLPRVTAQVFNLYAFDGFKHKEIAKLLKITEGTSQWHYSMAKQKLREWSAEMQASSK